MKATINIDGALQVWPENEIEAYALRQWQNNYRMGDDTSLLCLAWDHDTSSQADA
jgi:hypothetical protein